MTVWENLYKKPFHLYTLQQSIDIIVYYLLMIMNVEKDRLNGKETRI
jgi:hypothetical protein